MKSFCSGSVANDPTSSNCTSCEVNEPYVVYYPVEAGVTVTDEPSTTRTTTPAPHIAGEKPILQLGMFWYSIPFVFKIITKSNSIFKSIYLF